MNFKSRIITIFFWMLIPLKSFSADLNARYNMTRGVTEVSLSIYNLHMIVFWVCVAIGVVVFSVMFYSLIVHRKSRGFKAASFHEHPVLEMVWAIIPLLILIVLAIPATRVVFQMEDTSESDLTIKITGYQWKWKYEYLDQGISYFSNLATTQDEIHNRVKKNKYYLMDVDHPLVLPIHKKVRFVITSNDVIHSWWVPELGIKKDAVPGFIHDTWAWIKEPGTYRGQCAELCGIGHAYMPIVVVAKTEKEFEKWVEQKTGAKAATAADAKKEWTKDELMKIGKQVYTAHCSICHQPNGEGLPPAFPSIKGSKIVVGPVMKHLQLVLHGVENTAMQAFGEQLTDTEVAAVTTYQRNSWGNDSPDHGSRAGGIVTPADVGEAR